MRGGLVQRGPDRWAAVVYVGRGPDDKKKYRKAFIYTIRRLGLPKGVSFHTLRHACASVLLEHRVPLPAVSLRLGHTKISTTANIYAHVLPGEDEEASAAMDAALRAAGVQIPALPAGEGKRHL